MYLNCRLKGSLRCAILGVTVTRLKCYNVESLENRIRKKQKQNNPITWKPTVIVRSNLLCQENVFFVPSPPQKKDQTKQKQKKKNNTKQNIRAPKNNAENSKKKKL